MVQECTNGEESSAEQDGDTRSRKKGHGVVVKKALDEAYTSHLCLSSFCLFFYISYVCIFLPTEERVNMQRENKAVVMNAIGT